MFCEKCGAQAGEDSLFCPACGHKMDCEEESSKYSPDKGEKENVEMEVIYCPNCGVKNEADAAFCISCGTSLKEGFGRNGGKRKAASGKRGKKLSLGIAAAAVIAAGIIVCVMKFGGGDNSRMPLVYLKDNEIVCFDGKEKNTFGEGVFEEEELSGRFGWYAAPLTQFSADGKYIFYPQNTSENIIFDLYCKPVKDKKAEGEKIASSVENYTVLKNGKVVYLEENKLYISDLENREKIASDVLEYRVSADGKSILIGTTWEDRRFYICGTDFDTERKKLDSDVSEVIYASDDFGTILYRKEEGLYCLKGLEDREKITSESVTDYCLADSGKNTVIYYLEKDGERFSFRDLIQDDLTVKEPEERFLREYFLHDCELPEWDVSTLYCYDTVSGEKKECARGVFPFGIDAYAAEDSPAFSYLCCDEEQVEAVRLSDIAKWDEESTASTARVCGEIWKNLSAAATFHLVNGTRDIGLNYDRGEFGWAAGVGCAENTGDYYIYTISMDAMMQEIRDAGGLRIREPNIYLPVEREQEKWVTSEAADSAVAAEEAPAAEAPAAEAPAEETAAEESAWTGDYDYYREYDSFLRRSERADGRADTGKEITYAVYKTNFEKMDGSLELVAEDVLNAAVLTDGGIYCMEVTDGDRMEVSPFFGVNRMEGELFFDGNRVDYDVALDWIVRLADGSGIIYLTDFNEDRQEGTLKICMDGETEKIADDAAAFQYYFNGRGEAVFFADYSFGKDRGDLKGYDGKKVTFIDSDVTCVLNFE